AAQQATERGVAREKSQRGGLVPIAFHARKQSQAGDNEDDVGGPHSEEGRNDSLARHACPDDEKQIVAGDDEDGEQSACGAAAAAGWRADGHGDQRESKAREGKRETLIEFDASFAPARAVVIPQIGERAFRIAEGTLFGGGERVELDGPVATLERGDG